MTIKRYVRTRYAVIALCVSAVAVQAATDTSVRPHMTATALDVLPVLDGKVRGDPAWAGIKPIDRFVQKQPDNGLPATQRTEVFLGYSAEFLHVGIICYEEDPSLIRISNVGWESDSFSMVLDTFGSQQSGYLFGTNPVGEEYDGSLANEFVDWNWSTKWDVAASMNDDGWSAEFQIPFTSLRYGRDEVQSWGANFGRVTVRNNEISYWSPTPIQFSMYRLSLAGTVNDIHVPKQRRNLKLLPYGVANEQRGGTSAPSEDDSSYGFDVKYSITPSLTLDLTVNTDFAQVESDQLQINLGRFNLFFPETRPFFLENASYFSVNAGSSLDLFASRTIGIAPDGRRLPIDGGIRVSGKAGQRVNVGALHMRTSATDEFPSSEFSVLRVSRLLSNRTNFGAIVTDRRGGFFEGQTFGVDGRWGLGEHTEIAGVFARTTTDGIEDDDFGYSVVVSYNSPKWSHYTSVGEVGEGFNPQMGFVSRTDYRKFDTSLIYTIENPNFLNLQFFKPLAWYNGFWNFDGHHESGSLHLELWGIWRSGADAWTAVEFNHEGVRQAFHIAGEEIPEGSYDTRNFILQYGSPGGRKWSGGVGMERGGFYNGERLGIFPYLNYRRDKRLNAWGGYTFNRIDLPGLDHSLEVDLGRIGLGFSFTPKREVHALLQYNGASDVFAANVRFSWLRSATTGFFIVYNEIDASGLGPRRREFVVKYSHLFDLL